MRPVFYFLRLLLASLIAFGLIPWSLAESGEPARHGIAMYGEPALPPDFHHLPYANPDAPRGGRIVLALRGTFDSLNPLIVLGVAPDAVPRYVLQSLMMRSQDEPYTVYGLVAQSAEMPDDRSSVTFKLDPRARFSDGHPLTAEDVRFTFELLKQHGKPSVYRRSFSQVVAVEISDPHRIRFDLSGSNNRELPLIIATMPIFPAHATDAEKFASTNLTPPIGSGPYAITEVRPGERIVLKRRQDYWGEDLPITRGLYNFDEITYDFYRDANTLFEAFKAGLYDYRLEGEPVRWATGYDFLANNGRVVREIVPIRTPKGMNGFVFNTRRPLFRDVRVREALGQIFDFDWINQKLYFGLLQRSTSYFAGSDLSANGRPADWTERQLLAAFPDAVRPDILEGQWMPAAADGSGRDREAAHRALALLREAGWSLDGDILRHRETGESFSFEILVISRDQERLALNFAQSLRRIGISPRVRLVDEVQYWRRLARFEFDMVQWFWPASPSPGIEQRGRWSSVAASENGSLNYAGARLPAIDGLIDAMLEAKDRPSFVSAVRALDRVLLSGFFVIPLYNVGDLWLAYDSGLAHPPGFPLFGPNIDVWWRKLR